MIIQIYEIQTPVEAALMVDLGVDHVGSVLLDQEPLKQPLLKETTALVADSPSRSSLIPLFNDTARVLEVLDYYQPDIVHFCENLNHAQPKDHFINRLVALQHKVKECFPQIQVMRAIPIPPAGIQANGNWLELARCFESCSDYFLTDTLLGDASEGESSDKDQPVKGFVGITGQTCDWQMARELVNSTDLPVILAGGMSPDNARQGLEQVYPAGIDSCTRTNALDDKGRPIRFQKDPERVKAFVRAVREYEQNNG